VFQALAERMCLVRVTFGIRCDAYAKVVAVLFADVADEIDGPRELLFLVGITNIALCICILPGTWRVTPERQDVANTQSLWAVEPPAPQVTLTNRGRRARAMRSRRSRRFEKPMAVLGGKNSREK
jgi:hypothetical protein